MEKHLKDISELTDERKNEIANLIADHYLRENFRFISGGDYRRRLGDATQKLGPVSPEELHEFILSKLPYIMAEMFGWTHCSITGKTAAG